LNGYSNGSKIKIEPKTAGKSIVSQLKATTMLNVIELDSPKDDKITRVSAISPICEAKRVKFVRGAYLEKFIEQLVTFPNAKHDDMTDVFAYAVEDLLASTGFDFAFL
jgi:predicted phage terminase large subunit-like protein